MTKKAFYYADKRVSDNFFYYRSYLCIDGPISTLLKPNTGFRPALMGRQDLWTVGPSDLWDSWTLGLLDLFPPPTSSYL